MRSYCAVYVDVGYLLSSAATRVTGSSLRRGIQIDHVELVERIVGAVEADSGLPMLRLHWYDSGARPGGMPDLLQEQIGLLPRVKLRLGRLSFSGEQKGVDLRIGLDLVTHGRHRVADVFYLVSGDDDLTEAVEEAQGHGIQVVLLAVPGPDGRAHSVAKHLQRAADGLVVLDSEILDSTVRPMAIPAALLPSAPSGEGAPGEGAADEAGAPDEVGPGEVGPGEVGPGDVGPGDVGPGEVGPGEATPGAVARGGGDGTPAEQADAPPSEPGVASAPPARSQPPAAAEPAGRPVDGAELQRVELPPAEVDQPDPASGDEGESASAPPSPSIFARRRATTVVPPTPAVAPAAVPVSAVGGITPVLIDRIAKQVVASWCSSATPQLLVELRQDQPTIPHELDRALLVDLSTISGVDELDNATRHAVRERFWHHVGRVRMR